MVGVDGMNSGMRLTAPRHAKDEMTNAPASAAMLRSGHLTREENKADENPRDPES